MADDSKKIVRVSAESDKAIRTYAERRGLDMGEAADALIATAVSRLNALKKYSKNHKGDAKPAPKKKTKAKAKSNGAAAHA